VRESPRLHSSLVATTLSGMFAMVLMLPAPAGSAPGVGDAAVAAEPAADQHPAPSSARATIELPKTIGSWTRPDAAEVYDAGTLFDYMNGGAEVYLGYRFDHVEVYEYTAPDTDELIVELYWMKTSDDAFGLLSLDWNGESLLLGRGGGETSAAVAARSEPVRRALYNFGTLRVWSADLYARVIAYDESDTARQAVVDLGQAIVADRPHTTAPDWFSALPPRVGEDLMLETDHAAYVRSHHSLNAVYFLHTQNILDLGQRTEAVLGRYARTSADRGGESAGDTGDSGRSPWLLLVRYSHSRAARDAEQHFITTFSDVDAGTEQSGDGMRVFEVRDGWYGTARSSRHLALALAAEDPPTARMLAEQALQSIAASIE
jgi:hypothetical protein